MKYNIETVLCTTLLPLFELEGKQVVVIDVLRATTSITTALANGAQCIIPVASKEEARKWSEKGYLVATERGAVKLDFANFGNSPQEFVPERVRGEEIVYSTTNGTVAITAAGQARSVMLGSFANLSALAEHLQWQPDADLVLLCSGWKGMFNLEDTIFAGALAARLLEGESFSTRDDATNAAVDLWRQAEGDLLGYMDKLAHKERLESLGLMESFAYCFDIDSTSVVPQYVAGRILPGPLGRG